MGADRSSLRHPTFVAFGADAHALQALHDLSVEPLGLQKSVYDGGLEAARRYLSEHHTPGILVLDVGHLERPVSAVAAIAALCEPGVAVIVMGDRNDVGLFRGLIALGVTDYLVKPLAPGLLQRSIERILSKGHHPSGAQFASSGQVVAFLGCRGGVGTTTLCTSVAHVLSDSLGRRSVIFDAGAQTGQVAHFLGLEAGKAYLDAMADPNRIDPILVERHCVPYDERLSVLSCHVSLAEQVTYTPEGLYATLKALKQIFPYVFVDVPRSFGDGMAQAILSVCNTLCLVTDPTLISLRDMVRISALVSEMGLHQPQMAIILNRVGEYRHRAMSPAEFEEAARVKIAFNVRFDERVPMRSLMEMKPVSAYAGGMRQDILHIAQWLVGGRVHGPQTLWQRLKASLNDSAVGS
ncbi:MAG: CpaE family protein [Holosporales bacterium]